MTAEYTKIGGTKLTDEKAERIIQAVRAGNFLDVAAAFAQVHRTTFWRWLERGRNAADMIEAADGDTFEQRCAAAGVSDVDVRFAQFHEEVDRARADAEVRAVTLIQKAAEGDARHAEWFLERSFPDRWGARQRTELVGDGGGPVRLAGDDQVALAVAQAQQLTDR